MYRLQRSPLSNYGIRRSCSVSASCACGRAGGRAGAWERGHACVQLCAASAGVLGKCSGGEIQILSAVCPVLWLGTARTQLHTKLSTMLFVCYIKPGPNRPQLTPGWWFWEEGSPCQSSTGGQQCLATTRDYAFRALPRRTCGHHYECRSAWPLDGVRSTGDATSSLLCSLSDRVR